MLLSGLTLSTPTVPATGHATALVTLDKPAMVRLSAQSPSGTSCEVVDRVRGPFAQDGQAGRRNCKLDLLLDQGSYKLRLESSQRGKGKPASRRSSSRVNPTPQRLVPGSLSQLTLKSGQQASYGCTSPTAIRRCCVYRGATPATCDSGATASGSSRARSPTTTSRPSRASGIHEWWLRSALEEGDYLVTVYGTQEHQWPGRAENDALEVALGVRDGPAEAAVPFTTLGPSGIAAVRVPAIGWMALLSLDAAPKAAAELVVNGGAAHATHCRIEKKALVPQCAVVAYSEKTRQILMVRGPGTQGVLEWAPATPRTRTRGATARRRTRCRSPRAAAASSSPCTISRGHRRRAARLHGDPAQR